MAEPHPSRSESHRESNSGNPGGNPHPFRSAARALVAVLLVAAIALLAQVPMGAEPTEAALRLSLRAPASIQECRERTPEELAALPLHMRSPTTCETHALRYLLRVTVAGTVLLEETVTGTGLRRERPLVVYRDLALAPGRHALEVTMTPDPGAPEEAPSYHLDRIVELEPGQIALVTVDRGELRLASPGAADTL